VKQAADDKQGARDVKPDVADAAQLGKCHQQQDERHIFKKIAVSPDTFRELQVSAIVDGHACFCPEHDDVDREAHRHETERGGVETGVRGEPIVFSFACGVQQQDEWRSGESTGVRKLFLDQ
jgi:hypothetical protein